MSGINYGQAINNAPVPLTPRRQIMCCSSIEVTSQKAPSTDPAHVAERMMFFLCSYWAGKEPEQDTGASQLDLLTAANFSGVIRVSEHSTTTNNGHPARGLRWFASYHPDHPKSSKLALIGNRGTGPDGKYMEIQERKVMMEMVAGRLFHTNIDMEYGDCMNHRQTIFLARWFEFRDDPAAILRSPQLVVDGKIGTPQGAGAPIPCKKCRGNAPDGEFRVNIYSGRENPTICVACQAYRRHREPQRKSRAKAKDAAVQNKNSSGAGQSMVANQAVNNSQLLASNQAFDNSQFGYNNQTFDNSQMNYNNQIFDNSQMSYNNHPFDYSPVNYNNQAFGGSQVVDNNHGFDYTQALGSAQFVGNSQAIDVGQFAEQSLFASTDENIDPSLLPQYDQAASDGQSLNLDWSVDDSQAADGGPGSIVAYNASTNNDASMQVMGGEENFSQNVADEDHEDHEDLYRAD